MNDDLKKYEEVSEILKAISHPVRLCIVSGLLNKGKCNVSHMQECLNIPQSTISQHLQKLKAARVIEGTRSGLEINYCVTNQTVVKIIEAIL